MLAANVPTALSPLDVISLSRLMERTAGRPEVVVGLIDGPVATDRADLAAENIRLLPPPTKEPSERATGAARAHGTYIAGILSARRGSAAPAICPGCTLLVRPIFLEPKVDVDEVPNATPDQLADAIAECVDAGARVLNLSVAVAQPSPNRERQLEQALDHAMSRGAIVVAAAGNQGLLGSSAITRRLWPASGDDEPLGDVHALTERREASSCKTNLKLRPPARMTRAVSVRSSPPQTLVAQSRHSPMTRRQWTRAPCPARDPTAGWQRCPRRLWSGFQASNGSCDRRLYRCNASPGLP